MAGGIVSVGLPVIPRFRYWK